VAHHLEPARWAREVLGFDPNPVQEQVLSPNNRHGILNCSRQWGKSTLTALKAVHRACFERNSLVLVVSPSERQSAEFVMKAAQFMCQLGLRVKGDGKNKISLLFPNGSRIVGLPSKEMTVRGFSAVSLLIVDEAARVPNVMYDSIRPMLAVSDGDLWLMSTPFGRRGFFYEEWVGNDPDWTRVTATAEECPRISKRFLEKERTKISEAWFRQEYLCEFTLEAGALFDEAMIRGCIQKELKPLMAEAGWRR
jgi:Terminase large subunit, T4likevirus-type, N-terminal